MSTPSTQAHDSTLLTTFDSTPSLQPDLSAVQHKLGLSQSAAHPTPSIAAVASSSSPIHKAIPVMPNVASSSFTSTAPVPSPASLDNAAARSAEHGVSPVINAFRSPYPPSPTYFVTVVPPDDVRMSPDISQTERDRLQRGSLVPLYPTLGGQLWAISREFALPSLAGLMLYLSDDGQGNRGPRIGDASWQALWARYFNQDDAPSTLAFKPQTAFTPSRRTSTIAQDSLVDPNASSSAHAADLSRSTLGEASSGRPSIPYLSSRPSPSVDASAFSRRDASADWSPSARSAAWSGHASSSAGRVAVPVTPFPQLPILARIEWQVDPNKAPWWSSWIASRSAVRERPSHKTRKSMHLADNLSQPKERVLDAHEDEEPSHEMERPEEQQGEKKIQAADDEGEDEEESQILFTRGPEPHIQQLPLGHVETTDAGPSAPRSISPVHRSLAEPQVLPALSGLIHSDTARDEQQDSPRSLAPSTSARSLPPIGNNFEAPPSSKESAISNEERAVAPVAELAAGRGSPSPSDAPLRSERASIVSMSPRSSRRMSSTSRVTTSTAPKDPQVVGASAHSIEARSDTASPQSPLDPGAAALSHYDASDQSRTGYTEILDVNDANEHDSDDEHEQQEEDDLHRDPLSHAHGGGYSALPDSPTSETHHLVGRPAASEREQPTFSPGGFPLRHSFIVDAGDEAMWRDLHHHGMDQMIPEPRDDSHTMPSEHHEADADDEAQYAHAQRSERNSNGLELRERAHYDDVAPQQAQPTVHHWASLADDEAPQDMFHQQRFIRVDDFAQDAYYSPQRSNMARIQSWIGKTPTGRPSSSGAFDDDLHHFDRQADDQGLELPAESEIDEVVGLWASKVHQDPYSIPHISGPTAAASVSEEEQVAITGAQRDEAHDEAHNAEMQDQGVHQRIGEANSLGANTAPAVSLLSPIHLDSAAFAGVRPQLGNLTVPLSPQLLSPTAVGDAFNTPRASPDQRSVSTSVVQSHPPSSPSSLAPPLDRKASTASRRSSGDLSDTLQEMEKALELLSPSCSPNPALGHSPDPMGRKMSSRDSLAYARSLSASVTPSPKWIARAKAATAKTRTHARRTFAVGGSPFDLSQVSPRPASTSAVSSSRARSPGFRAPLSASRLIEFAQVEAVPHQAMTEGGDAESTRSDGTGSVQGIEPERQVVSKPVVHAQHVLPSGASLHSVAGEVVRVDPRRDTTSTAKSREDDAVKQVSSEHVHAKASSPAAAPTSAPSAPDAEIDEAEHTEELSAFMTDDHEDGIASIQRFLRGKVVSGVDSDASVLPDQSVSGSGQHPGSSAAGTIIERSVSQDSDLLSAATEQRASDVRDAPAAGSVHQETASDPRWSQASYVAGDLSSHHPSGYSLHSNSPKRDLHHEVRTPSFTYDAHLSSEPTTVDTQLSSASADGEGLSVAGEVVKSDLSSSPSDETFFISSGPARGEEVQQPQQQQQQGDTAVFEHVEQGDVTEVAQQHLTNEDVSNGQTIEYHAAAAAAAVEQPATSGPIPALAYRFASSPIHADTFSMTRPLAGTHEDSLDEEEIRTMHEDTRAAVREALSQSTAHHVNILPAVAPLSTTIAPVGGPQSPKSSASPTASPLSSHLSLGDHFRRRGSASSLNPTSTGGGSGSNASSPKRRPSRLNLDIDGLTRSPPPAATVAVAAPSARRLPSTSPRSRFGQLPPSPSLHPSYKAAMSSPLSQSFPVMGMGSPQGKTFLPSLASVTSLEGEMAGSYR
ncbi:uncharacterized protein SRS1_15170 [Sporisorium reilianum f. sp. reilianum]|uniref:Uncharacterized protein n=1 Tax=Sporisorium reilianum f. sp. reilianum TaxID=72559 RepID=A0A2N8UHT7_9BASI|nr:uncharacterized protein SRS1_15170 [Sporisorium reilianum f. sp. reilianum]